MNRIRPELVHARQFRLEGRLHERPGLDHGRPALREVDPAPVFETGQRFRTLRLAGQPYRADHDAASAAVVTEENPAFERPDVTGRGVARKRNATAFTDRPSRPLPHEGPEFRQDLAGPGVDFLPDFRPVEEHPLHRVKIDSEIHPHD